MSKVVGVSKTAPSDRGERIGIRIIKSYLSYSTSNERDFTPSFRQTVVVSEGQGKLGQGQGQGQARRTVVRTMQVALKRVHGVALQLGRCRMRRFVYIGT